MRTISNKNQWARPVRLCICVVRLIRSDPMVSEGRLEVYSSGHAVWGTVCDHHFSNASAKVACHTLGFGYVV